MIRDNESVESRTACLLRSTANRRVSLLSFDASTEAKNVKISWNIKIKEQLRQWVLDQLNKIIKMLDELRDQWDMILKCNKHWIILQIEHTQRLKQLEINHAIMNTLEEINIQLRKKMLILQREQSSPNQSQSRQNIESQASIENHTWRETFKSLFKLFVNNYHWFYKFSNLFIFTDEGELT